MMISDTDHRINLALKLFDVGAIKFGSFRLKLHEKNPNAPLSPIYIDLRLLRSFPDVLDAVVDEYNELAKSFDYDIFADVPTAATPFVSVLSHLTRIPMISVRKEEKSHGDSTRIDGKYKEGQKVLLIDDLITKADSKIEAIAILEENGLIVCGVIVLIDREQGGGQQLGEKGYQFMSVYALSWLLDLYLEKSKINQKDYDQTLKYLQLI